MMFGENGGRVAVFVGEGASVKAVAVSVEVTGVAVSVAVPVGVSVRAKGVVVFVIVTITGVIVKIDGVIVGGGAGKVGTVYDQPLQAVSAKTRKKFNGMIFFIPRSCGKQL
jgi:hypothetical protein